jgi:hypothetical protein
MKLGNKQRGKLHGKNDISTWWKYQKYLDENYSWQIEGKYMQIIILPRWKSIKDDISI